MVYIYSRGFYGLCNVKNKKAQSSNPSLDPAEFLAAGPGSVFYVCNTALTHFFHSILPLLTHPFVLVSGDSDNPMPFDRLSHSEFQTFVSDPRLLHWFCQNLLVAHPKLTHLPIGLDYHTLENHIGLAHPWGPGMSVADQDAQLAALARTAPPLAQRKLLCYSNIHHAAFGINARGDRQEVLATVPRELLCCSGNYTSRLDAWKEQRECAFVLSPRGGGYDCHRTWEALILGCIPVVKTSGLDPVYEGLPVLILESWSDLTAERMARTLVEFSRTYWKLEKLTLEYWAARIRAFLC